jgi:hypothetical protein
MWTTFPWVSSVHPIKYQMSRAGLKLDHTDSLHNHSNSLFSYWQKSLKFTTATTTTATRTTTTTATAATTITALRNLIHAVLFHLTWLHIWNNIELYLLGLTQCIPLKVIRCFGGTYSLHLQSWRINQARNQRESRWQALLAFTLVSCLTYFSKLIVRIETTCSSGTSADFQRNTLSYIPDNWSRRKDQTGARTGNLTCWNSSFYVVFRRLVCLILATELVELRCPVQQFVMRRRAFTTIPPPPNHKIGNCPQLT